MQRCCLLLLQTNSEAVTSWAAAHVTCLTMRLDVVRDATCFIKFMDGKDFNFQPEEVSEQCFYHFCSVLQTRKMVWAQFSKRDHE